VTRGEDHVDLEPGHLELLSARQRVLGVPALVRAEAGPRHERHDVREHDLLDLGHPDLGAGGLRDRSDGADVVEVGVGQQDALEVHAERLDRAQQLLGLLARIDDQGLFRVLTPEEEAVLLHLPDGEHADLDAHFFASASFF
jgi:hypothetical protein